MARNGAGRWGAPALLALLMVLAAGCTGAGGDPGKTREAGGLPGRVAYVKDGDIYIQAGTAAPVRVTQDGKNTAPAWSPDGRGLLFIKKEGGAVGSLWLVGPDGQGAGALAGAAKLPAFWGTFAWAPTGDKVAYAAFDAQQQVNDLYVQEINGAGGGQGRSVIHSTGGIHGFAWAPDGARVAAATGSFRPGSGEPARIQAVPASGGKAEVLLDWRAVMGAVRLSPGAPPLTDLGGLTWSPDGKWISFFAMPSSSALTVDGVRLFLLPSAGGLVKPAGEMLAYPQWLVWSPRGDRFAMVAGPGRDAGQVKHVVLVSPEDPTTPVELTPAGSADKDPAWSPDGRLVVLSRAPEGATVPRGAVEPSSPTGQVRGGIAVAGGMKPLAITAARTDGVADVAPQFSADGTTLLWLRFAGKSVSLWTAPAAGGEPRQVVPALDAPPGYYGALHTAAVFSWHNK